MFKKPTMIMSNEKTNGSSGATLISAGTTVKGDISSNHDLRIDGSIIGNVSSSAKIVIGASGSGLLFPADVATGSDFRVAP